MTRFRDHETGVSVPKPHGRPAILAPSQYDLLVAREAAADRQDAANAHVTTYADETLLVGRLTEYLRTVILMRAEMTCDDAGRYLDDAGVPKTGDEAATVRRRIISVTINRGRMLYWKPDGLRQGKAGRLVTRWVSK